MHVAAQSGEGLAVVCTLFRILGSGLTPRSANRSIHLGYQICLGGLKHGLVQAGSAGHIGQICFQIALTTSCSNIDHGASQK